MVVVEKNRVIPREELQAIRRSRGYLRRNTGTLARILNAYRSAVENGTQRGYLDER